MIGASIKDIGKKDTMVCEVDSADEVRTLLTDYMEGRRGKVKFE